MKKFYFFLLTFATIHTTSAQDWQRQNPLPQANPLNCVRFVDANTGYAVGDCGTILKTINGGINWTLQSSTTIGNLNSVYFTDASTGYAVGREWPNGILLMTTDGGVSWTVEVLVLYENLYSIQFTSADTGYVTGEDGMILKTTDGGTNWTFQNTDSTFFLNSVFFTDANTGYAVGHRPNLWTGGTGIILKTVDRGIHWSTSTIGCVDGLSLISVYFTDVNTGYAVGTCGYAQLVIKTTDGGITWTNQSFSIGSLNSVYFPDANKGYTVGSGYFGIIQSTNDAGITWTSQYPDTTETIVLNSVVFTDENTGYAVGELGIILKTINGGGVGLNEKCVPSGFLQISPNPSSGKITTETPEISQKSYLSIYDLRGHELFKQTISGPKTVIDISNLNTGLYIIKVKGERSVRVGKIIKE